MLSDVFVSQTCLFSPRPCVRASRGYASSDRLRYGGRAQYRSRFATNPFFLTRQFIALAPGICSYEDVRWYRSDPTQNLSRATGKAVWILAKPQNRKKKPNPPLITHREGEHVDIVTAGSVLYELRCAGAGSYPFSSTLRRTHLNLAFLCWCSLLKLFVLTIRTVKVSWRLACFCVGNAQPSRYLEQTIWTMIKLPESPVAYVQSCSSTPDHLDSHLIFNCGSWSRKTSYFWPLTRNESGHGLGWYIGVWL